MPSASSPANLHIANDLRLANRNLKDAHLLHDDGSRNSAYHLEQAVEKVMLALLTSESIHIEVNVTHRLEILAEKLPEEHPFRDAMLKLAFLQSYATAFRYVKTGGRVPDPLPEERFAPTALAIRRLIDGVARHFDVDLTANERVPAGRIDPMRRKEIDNDRGRKM